MNDPLAPRNPGPKYPDCKLLNPSLTLGIAWLTSFNYGAKAGLAKIPGQCLERTKTSGPR
jgi:hypothetical protein